LVERLVLVDIVTPEMLVFLTLSIIVPFMNLIAGRGAVVALRFTQVEFMLPDASTVCVASSYLHNYRQNPPNPRHFSLLPLPHPLPSPELPRFRYIISFSRSQTSPGALSFQYSKDELTLSLHESVDLQAMFTNNPFFYSFQLHYKVAIII
jgi:hypothetical protein